MSDYEDRLYGVAGAPEPKTCSYDGEVAVGEIGGKFLCHHHLRDYEKRINQFLGERPATETCRHCLNRITWCTTPNAEYPNGEGHWCDMGGFTACTAGPHEPLDIPDTVEDMLG